MIEEGLERAHKSTAQALGQLGMMLVKRRFSKTLCERAIAMLQKAQEDIQALIADAPDSE